MEISPDHEWEKVGQGRTSHLREEERVGGWEPRCASHNPHHRVLGAPHNSHPRSVRGEEHQGERQVARWRTVGGEVEDGGGAVTSAREVEDEGVVEAGV
jgi:hypothetical protein